MDALPSTSVKFLYYLAKIWGLAPFTLENDQVFCGSSLEVLYPVVLTMLCVPQWVISTIARSQKNYSAETNLTRVVNIFCILIKFLGTTSSLMIFAFRRNMIVEILTTFSKCDAILGYLAVGQDRHKQFKTRAMTVGIVTFAKATLSLAAISIAIFTGSQDFTFSFIYLLVVGTWSGFVQHILICIFVNVIASVEERLRLLNQSLSNVCDPGYKSYRNCGWSDHAIPRNQISLGPMEELELTKKLAMISELYDHLHDLTGKTIALFSIQIVLTIGYYSTVLTTMCYYTYVALQSLIASMDLGTLYELLSTYLSLAIIGLELIAIGAVCSSTQSRAKSTVIALNKMWIKNRPNGVKNQGIYIPSIVSDDHKSFGPEEDNMYRSRSVKKLSPGSNPYATFLYYLAKIFGLAPFILEDNRVCRGSRCDEIYPLILTAIYAPLSAYAIKFWADLSLTDQSALLKHGDVTAMEVKFLGAVLSTILFARERDNIVKVINLFAKADEMLNSIGIRQDYEHRFKVFAIRVIASCCAIMVSDYIVIASFAQNRFTLWYVIFIFVGQWFFCVVHIMIFIFVISIMFVNERLDQLNRTLFKLFEPKSESIFLRGRGGMPASRTTPEVLNMVEGNSAEADIPAADDLRSYRTLVEIEKVQSSLHDVVEEIVRLFSIPLCVIISSYFLGTLMSVYYTSVTVRNLLETFSYEITYRTVAMISNLGIQSAELFAIAVACASTEKTGKSTAITLHKMWVEYHPHDLKDEIQMLSLQLLQRPLTISAFGFFSLDYSYLYKIFCAVVAYFVIMVQLDTSKVDAARNISTLAPNLTGTH